jgi:hypothetical protein
MPNGTGVRGNGSWEAGSVRPTGFHRGAMGSQARMSVFADVKSRAADLARTEKKRYSGDEERPLGGYLAAMGAYATVTGARKRSAEPGSHGGEAVARFRKGGAQEPGPVASAESGTGFQRRPADLVTGVRSARVSLPGRSRPG